MGWLGAALAGVAAALTLRLRPNFIGCNHQIMTESLSAMLVVLAGFLLHQAAGADGNRLRRHLVALGAVCGSRSWSVTPTSC